MPDNLICKMRVLRSLTVIHDNGVGLSWLIDSLHIAYDDGWR